MDEQTELLREMRDLLRVLAEPELAKRDQELRSRLFKVVGKSKPKADAVLLMDGERSQSAICRESGIDRGNLSRLMKQLTSEKLLAGNGKEPKLAMSIPATSFVRNSTE